MKNIFASGELEQEAVVSILETTAKDGKTYKVRHFNLDAILSVGYRVNSKQATHFRQWATRTLKMHIQKGYTLNRKRIQTNYEEFLSAIDQVKQLLPIHSASVDGHQVLELITLFADTWCSLDAYDRDALVVKGTTKKKVTLTAKKLTQALAELKHVLLEKREATDIFGVEIRTA